MTAQAQSQATCSTQSSQDSVLAEVRNHIGHLTLNRPAGLNAITLGFAIASLGFGLFRPGFTAGSSLAVTRAEQGQVAGIVASVNGAAYIIAPAIGVWLYNIAPLESFAIIIGLCVFVLVWGRTALQADEVLVRPN